MIRFEVRSRLLAGLPDAVIGVRPDLRLVLWNPAAEALTGRSARARSSRTLGGASRPRRRSLRHLGETLATGESRAEAEAEVDGDRRARDPREHGDGAHPRTERRCHRRGRGGARHLADPRARGRGAPRREALAAGQIALGLAHEIRNPLGAIRGVAQLLRRELGGEARWGEYTDVLLTEVDRVNRDDRNAAGSRPAR